MQEIFRSKAPAKVNLALDVVKKRADGYHEMRMLNHKCALFDEIELKKSERFGLSCSVPELSDERENIVAKALNLLAKESGKSLDFSVNIKKNIPVEAGLAGGSADAAAAMKLASRYWNLDITPDELADLAVRVGADVAYCLVDKTALVEGIGERVTEIAPFNPSGVLIVKPEEGVSTKKAFDWVDNFSGELYHPDIYGVAEALGKNDYKRLRECGGNTFLKPVTQRMPLIERLIETLYGNGAFYAGMSGSGSTVVGYFSDRGTMRRAAGKFYGLNVIETGAFNEPG